MPATSPAPYSATNFDVRFSGGDELAQGFYEVLFEPFVNSALPPVDGVASAASISSAVAGNGMALRQLTLRRGFDGSLALYQWWDKSRKRTLKRGRTVTVHLLDAGRHVPVLSWTFSNAQPLLLAYSPLNALHGGLLMETLTLRYDHVTMK